VHRTRAEWNGFFVPVISQITMQTSTFLDTDDMTRDAITQTESDAVQITTKRQLSICTALSSVGSITIQK